MKRNIPLVLILVVAFALRAYRLGHIPMWEDELWTAYRSGIPLFSMLRQLSGFPIHPPLYYLLLNLWVKCFGISEFALRLPSVLFSVLSVFFILKLGELLYDRRTGLCAAILLTVSPFNIYYAQEAKVYMASWTLGLISFWLFVRLTKEFRKTDLTAYMAVAIASLYVSYVGLIYCFIQGVALFFFRKPQPRRKWLLTYLFILVAYVPWLWFFFNQRGTWTAIRWIGQTDHYISRAFFLVDHVLHLFPFTHRVLGVSALLYMALSLLAIIELRRGRPLKAAISISKGDQLLLAWFLLPFFLYAFVDAFVFHVFEVPRYVGFVHIPLLLFLAKGICRLEARWWYPLTAFLICYVFTTSVYPYFAGGRKISDERWGEALSLVQKEGPPPALVVTPVDRRCLEYYQSGLHIQTMYPRGTLIYRGQAYRSIFVVVFEAMKPVLFLPEYFLCKERRMGNLILKEYHHRDDP